jgi:4'-phosphopantetheinyl transferase
MAGIKISSIEVSGTGWLSAARCDYSPFNGTDVWKIGISINLHRLDAFSAILSQDELERAKRYHHIRDTNRFIISRGALRMLLGKYLKLEPSIVEFGQGANKKPFIKKTDLFYNVSHSGDLILLSVSTSETGCDIELINRKFDFRDVLKDYFSESEGAFIQQENSIERFFTVWTRKEAFTKATGTGLDDDLKRVPSLDGDHPLPAGTDGIWLSKSLRIGTDYMATICAKHHSIFFYEFQL